MKKANLIIFHPNLRVGGAETQIINLINGLANKGYKIILALYDVCEDQLKWISYQGNVSVVNLRKSRRGYVGVIFGLIKILAKNRCATVYTFLVSQNVMAISIGKCLSVRRIVWGNRISEFPVGEFGWKGDLSFYLEKSFASGVDVIISNSQVGQDIQKNKGLRPKNKTVIRNGIDTNKYARDFELRKEFRLENRIEDDVIVIATVCRIVEWKGIETFIKAAGELLEYRKNVRFLCVGSGNRQLVAEYESLASELASGKFTWLGERLDVIRVLNGIDILTSASYSGEGFSNIVGEAMSVGIPVVTTDVGDNPDVLGETGIVVKPKDVTELINAWLRLIDNSDLRENLSKRSAKRVRSHYSLENMIDATERFLFV